MDPAIIWRTPRLIILTKNVNPRTYRQLPHTKICPWASRYASADFEARSWFHESNDNSGLLDTLVRDQLVDEASQLMAFQPTR